MNLRKIINILYQILFFSIPLVLYPYTSELFEFNKMVVTYILTVLIIFFWLIRMITEKKFIFKRTPLDIPILIFLGSQIISTLISLDIRTSIFGYYSRFNGGLLSLFSYFFLYWGFVSNLTGRDIRTSIKVLIASTLFASIYGILERFGIDKDVWIQDVQNRVFSTFGQPNWLAAWLAAVIPVSLSLGLNSSPRNKVLFYFLSSIFLITLLFTKSRSGILSFAVAISVFWGLTFFSTLRQKLDLKTVLKPFVICNLSFVILLMIIGSPWTPSVFELQSNQLTNNEPTITGPALEVGGSSSTEIRKIVWQGAIDVWKNYPLFGSGVETFAFSYYQFRPVSHNLVSEWDFLYNKAHNEFLNYAATTGTFGLISYLFLIICTIFLFVKKLEIPNSSPSQRLSGVGDKLLISNQNPMPKHKNFPIGNSLGQLEIRYLKFGLLSGYISILITNFFGFSVVPVNLLFYIFPAMAICLREEENLPVERRGVNDRKFNFQDIAGLQKIASVVFTFLTLFVLYSICRYWYADVLYNRADIHGKTGDLINSVNVINRAIKLSPFEAIYHDELASGLADIAVIYKSQENLEDAEKFSVNAMRAVSHAESLSPNNLNIIRNKARIAIKLSEINPSYILDAKKSLLKGIQIAPTEAKLYYNLALTYYRIGDLENTVKTLEKTIELKSNYKDARYAYAIILTERGEKDKAIIELEYILSKIDPNDENAKKTLDEFRGTAI